MNDYWTGVILGFCSGINIGLLLIKLLELE